MFTGPVGPVEVFFYWPEAVLGNFYWPGAIGPLFASSPEVINSQKRVFNFGKLFVKFPEEQTTLIKDISMHKWVIGIKTLDYNYD